MHGALYVRVATTRQQPSQTIEQQLARLQDYVATQRDWHLAEEPLYRDDGYSGAKLNRPGRDCLRDRAALAAFERVLITPPDRLARHFTHQRLLLGELSQRGGAVEVLDRPMSDAPHERRLLHIRGAVAEYDRTLMADRMRRGRQAQCRSGQRLPWRRAPYGDIVDPERPRDANRVRLAPVQAAVGAQLCAWDPDPQTPVSLYGIAKRLSDAKRPTASGKSRWNVATVRGLRRSSASAGTA